MPGEHLKNNARLGCIRGLYEARNRDIALREFDELLSLTPVRSYVLFRRTQTARQGPTYEAVFASPLADQSVSDGSVPEEWLAQVLRHEHTGGDAAANGATAAKSRRRKSTPAIIRLKTGDGLEAAAIALDREKPGEQAYLACLAVDGLRGEALASALEEWAWLIAIGASLLLRHFPALTRRDEDAVLSASEIRVLRGLARGLSAEQIAEETGRSLSTIRNQLRSARARLGARSTAETLAIAIQTKQIPI